MRAEEKEFFLTMTHRVMESTGSKSACRRESPKVGLAFGFIFANFDPDDPSDDLIIDPNGSTGDDNNGEINDSPAGQLSANFAETNADGEATVNFTVTRQPGDNFAIAAGTNQDQVGSVAVNGTGLIDGNGNEISIGCDGTDAVCRSEMLTVWRRLHIEVDSMGASQGNFVVGNFAQSARVGAAAVNVQVNTSQPLDVNRFENGRLSSGASNLRIVSNTTNSIRVRATVGGTATINAGETFQLYDDDDFNDNNGTSLNGDTGENVPRPDTDLMQDSDTACSDVFNTNNCNVFVNAYVRPTFDLIGEDIPAFSSNVDDADISSYRNAYFQNRAMEASETFWTVYLFGAYQYEQEGDGDPNEEGSTFGAVDDFNGIGASLFTETNRPVEYRLAPNWQSRPVGRRFTAAHEIGHLFYGTHGDTGLMAQTGTRINPLFDNRTINKIRGGEFIDITGMTRRVTHP